MRAVPTSADDQRISFKDEKHGQLALMLSERFNKRLGLKTLSCQNCDRNRA